MYLTQIKVQSISFTPESLLSPFPVNIPRREHHSDFYHRRLVLPVLELSYKCNQNIYDLLCLAFLAQYNVGESHPGCLSIGSVPQFTYPFPVDGHVDGFQFLAAMNKADKYVYGYVFWWTHALISFG